MWGKKIPALIATKRYTVAYFLCEGARCGLIMWFCAITGGCQGYAWDNAMGENFVGVGEFVRYGSVRTSVEPSDYLRHTADFVVDGL